MNKEEKANLTAIYKKYGLRDDVRIITINKDTSFDTSTNFYVTFVKSDRFAYEDEYATIHDHLYKVTRQSKTKCPVYPDDFTLIE